MAKKRNTGIESALSGIATPRHTRRKSTTPATVIVEPLETPAPQFDSTPADSAPAASVPTYEDIAALAYSFWEARGYQGGDPEEDWHRAEQELRAKA